MIWLDRFAKVSVAAMILIGLVACLAVWLILFAIEVLVTGSSDDRRR